MRWFGRLARFVVGLLVLAVAGAAGALVWYRHAAQPPASGQEALAGLRGQVDINGGPFNMAAPFGGYKQSGNGREWGKYGFEEFLEVKAVMGY